jgi:septum formation protein
MLILASGSPRRHEILTAAGIPHTIQTIPIDETRRPGEPPVDYVQRLAEEKARAISGLFLQSPGSIILAADTTVALDNDIFGKPENAEDAVRMLRALSGRDHYVYTGICLLASGTNQNKCIKDVAATRVSFLKLEDAEIQEYTRSGEPYDKAGAYAIQGLASKFISGIEGCYYNVVGLPVSLVFRHLKSF